MTANKVLALVCVFVLLSSLMVLTVKPADAQAVSKPSVPQFTLKFVAHPYDVPPTYTTNPYTGETTITSTGYHEENKTIEVTIKNRPFTPYTDKDGHKIELYYMIENKGRFDDTWSYWLSRDNPPPIQSNSEYTIVSWLARVNGYPVPDNAQVDFRVRAVVGYAYDTVRESGSLAWMYGVSAWYVQSQASSDWSDTQTITITDSSSPVTSSQTVPPQNSTVPPVNNQPQTSEQTQQSEQNKLSDFMFNPFFLLGIGALVGVGATLAVLVFTRRRLPRLQTDLAIAS